MKEKDPVIPVASPRIQEADRRQLRLVTSDLEAMIPADHSVRAVWDFVKGLDLSSVYASIKAVEGGPGRAPIDPKILLSVWLQGTLDGVGSARELERLCRYHVVYQWICGGVSVNYHTLSDFRSLSEDLLDELLTQSVAVLISEGVVDLKRVSQDGMHVRAFAGSKSFRRRRTLEEYHRLARQQVTRLRKELDTDPAASKRRQDAAQERASRDRAQRVAKALKQMPEVEKRKKSNNGKKKTEARVSTTDPDARVMKMADGGFRPAFNIHMATATNGTVIVAVDVNNDGNEAKMMEPLAEQMRERYGQTPEELLADGGCVTLDNINTMSAKEPRCVVYGPIRAPRRDDRKPSDIRSTDTAAIAEWRARMDTDQAKQIYKQRAATAEWSNAQFRNHGLGQFLVRGFNKVRSVALLHALTTNMTRHWALI